MHFRAAFSFLLLASSVVALAPPAHAQWKDGATALTAPSRVPGRQLQARRSLRGVVGPWMMVAGGALLVGGWGANALAGFSAGVECSIGIGFYGYSGGGGGSGCQHNPQWESFREWSLVPVVGPYMQLATLPEDGRGGAWPGWTIASAVLQTSGLALVLAGLIATLLAPDTEDEKPPPFAIAPVISPSQVGVNLRSTF